jgi:radical SAM-linked protein
MQSDETLLIRFSMEGGVCYLSQQETLTMWRRCLARAGMSVSFSQGFNPHPKISLPLPRSVGVEGDEELLRVGLQNEGLSVESMAEQCNQHLPAGCKVRNAERCIKKISCQPVSVLYVITPRTSWWNQETSQLLEQRRQAIETGQSCVVFRYGPKHKAGRKLDIGTYFQSLEWDAEKIKVRCRFSNEGTVRVEEVLNRLGLTHGDLERAVLRTKIEWQTE